MWDSRRTRIVWMVLLLAATATLFIPPTQSPQQKEY